MRRIPITLAVVLGLVLLASDAHAGGWSLEDYLTQGRTHDWAGFGVGTMIHTRTTREMALRGQATPQRLVEEERKTLLQVTRTEFVFQVDTLSEGRWTKTTVREPRVTGLKAHVAEAGADKVTVGGTAYDCRKKKVRWMLGRQLSQEATLWVHATQGILRMTWTGDMAGETRVAKLAATRRIHETTVHGREQTLRMTNPGAPTMKGTQWVSLDVPERMVYMEMSGSRGNTSFKVTQELIAFLRK